jgi:hypothetical protein
MTSFLFLFTIYSELTILQLTYNMTSPVARNDKADSFNFADLFFSFTLKNINYISNLTAPSLHIHASVLY